MRAVGAQRKRVHGGDPTVLVERVRQLREPLLDFSVDTNPFGAPACVRTVVINHVDDLFRYPDPRAIGLRRAIAALHQIPMDAVLPANGSAELIGLLACVRPITRSLVIVPAFTEYEWTLESRGVDCVRVTASEADRFHIDWNASEWRERLDGVELVFLCNPNNPTGVAVSKEQVLRLAQWCRDAGSLLVVDEAFIDFVDEPDTVSVIREAVELEQLVVLRSLTKQFAVPGLRLGYLVGPPDVVETMRSLQQPWPLNALALAVGTRLLDEQEFVTHSRRQIRRLREQLVRTLDALPGLQPLPSSVNFILCKLTDRRVNSSELVDALAARGLLLRNCDDFTGLEPGRFIRMAVLREAAQERHVAALHAVLA